MAEPLPTHRPVMVEQVLAALAPAPGRCLLDGTLGLGGHAEAWLEACGPEARVIGFDRDASALERARERLARFGHAVTLVHGDYRDASAQFDRSSLPRPDAVLLDLGLGSHQIDDPERGFSFRHEARLDMRFDERGPGPTAAEIVNRSSEPELARILADFGEERAARKLARRLVDERQRAPIETTTRLAEIVRATVPSRGRQRIDPATRTFQALRIATNRELEGLDEAIEDLVRLLPLGGRIAVIAFHSIEDRVSKRTLRRLATRIHVQPGDDPAEIPEQLLEMPVRRAVPPTEDEIAANPRARSAKLRWGVRR